MELNSNFSKKKLINRSQALEYVVSALKEISSDYSLSFNGANAYVLPYADSLQDVPYTDSGYLGETAAVPFLQLAVSGSIECQSTPINLSDDLRKQLLYCIQSNTVPTFLLSYNNTEKLKLTNYSKNYAVDFGILENSIVDSYNYLNEALSATNDTRLTAHNVIADGVVCATYENGVKIYVNLNDTAYTNGNISIEPLGYTVQ